MTTRIGVYGVAVRDKKILLVKEIDGPYKGLLHLPGGGVEFGETQLQTLRREFQEETAMAFADHWLFDNLSYSNDTFHHLGQIYWVRNLKAIPDAKPEIHFAWYPLKDLKDNLSPFATTVVQRLQIIFRKELVEK